MSETMQNNSMETAADGPTESLSRQIELMDLERLVELDFIRTTEAAALNAYRWMGRGNPQEGYSAAVDAMRGTLDLTSVSATVVFGGTNDVREGGFEVGERVGNWMEGSLKMDVAVIPIDGDGLVASGSWGAMSVLAAASTETDDKCALLNIPSRLVDKIAYGPAVAAGPAQLNLNASVRDNLEIIAMKLGKRVQDLCVAVLDRPHHADMIDKIRKAGASVRLIADGEVAASIAPCYPETGFDVYMGRGGSSEATIASAALRCLGGDIIVRTAPENDEERQCVLERLGKDGLDQQYRANDLSPGDNVLFCATGITDGSILRGVHVEGNKTTTSSVVMRTRFKTVRRIYATHDLSRKTIRLHSAGGETTL